MLEMSLIFIFFKFADLQRNRFTLNWTVRVPMILGDEMRLFILVFYLVITVFMIAVILFQRSEASSGLGGGTMAGMMTARGTANLLTRMTAVLAALFMGSNLLLAYLAKQEIDQGKIRAVESKQEISAPLKPQE